MDAIDDSRKQWASLLTGKGDFIPLALSTWLGLAASALGGDASARPSAPRQESPLSATQDSAMEACEPIVGLDWVAALGPIFNAWTEAIDNLQGSAVSWFSPPSDNPLARVMSHPAAVVGNDSSPGRLSMQAGMALFDFMQVAATHQALQTQGWAKALQRFVAEFVPSEDGDAQPTMVTSVDQLLTHWGVVGEAALQEHSRSEKFLESQAQMLRKAMQYRVANRRVVEAAARANDLPTLTDLDEAFASIHALRREVREVRKLAEAAAAGGAAAVASAAVSKAKAKAKAGARRTRSAA
jgi:hypothetical protein